MYCGKCGKENVDNIQFCIHCGTDLSGLTPVTKRAGMESAANDTIDGSATIFRGQLYEGKVLAGQFRIISNEPLGAGGMGEVWEAQDTELGTTVAIKVLPPIMARDKVAISNLKREAMIGQQLAHPNICRLFSFHSDEELKFIVMGDEYVCFTIPKKIEPKLPI